ncbi:MAG: LysE family translocator [Rhizobiales bacterium]|nr:LysE family translocator [Hyphomicrobiales bacterium]
MPSSDLLIPFFVATVVFAFVPGPGMLYAAAQTIAGGHRAGWLSMAGLHIGGYAHILAAAFGLAVMLEAVPALYAIVKFVGAAYLIWFGIKLFRSTQPVVMSTAQPELITRHRALRDSIAVSVLNPKTALFYLAFLPQFTDISALLPVWGQILVLGTIVNFMFSATDAVCVLVSERMTKLLIASQAANRFARRIGGGILVALGVNLAVSRQ